MLRFGVFELSPENNELRKRGLLIRLAPQPFQVLCILLEHAGEVVTRDELRIRIWGSDTNVEFDAGLNRCVRQIRGVLSDDSDSPRYIETIPRQGYKFIAKVEGGGAVTPGVLLPVTPLPTAPVSPEPNIAPASAARKHRFLIPGIASFTILAIVAGWLLSEKSKHPVDLTAVPFAVALGDQYAPTFSPDGRQIAFAWNGERRKHFDIYVKEINSPAPPLRLTSSGDTNYSPAWSPDGRLIAFYRYSSDRNGGIWVVGALGGPARKIANLDLILLSANRDLAWSPDSRSLVVVLGATQQNPSQILRIDVESGDKKLLNAGAAGEHYLSPAVSPDGRTVAFTRDIGPGSSTIRLLSLSGGTPSELKAEETAPEGTLGVLNRSPTWTPDGKYIVFSSGTGGRDRLWLAPAEGNGPLQELTALGEGANWPWISPLGQLAFVHQEYDTNIWRLDLHRTVSDPSPNPTQVVSSTRLETNPALSSDGRRLAFSSDQSGFSEIWTSDPDGNGATRLTSTNSANTGSPDWSPDGKQIVFDSRIERRPHLYLVPAVGGRPRKLMDASGVVPHWSPDGKWIYYSSDASGQMEIWRVYPTGSSPERITKKGGFGGILSTNSKFLYFTADNAPTGSLWEMELATRDARIVADSVLNRGYAVLADALYYIQGHPETDDHSLYRYDLKTRKAKVLFQLQHRIERGISLSPDGQSLYYPGIDRENHELRLVNHFWK